jgi:hypothetical protein
MNLTAGVLIIASFLASFAADARRLRKWPLCPDYISTKAPVLARAAFSLMTAIRTASCCGYSSP